MRDWTLGALGAIAYLVSAWILVDVLAPYTAALIADEGGDAIAVRYETRWVTLGGFLQILLTGAATATLGWNLQRMVRGRPTTGLFALLTRWLFTPSLLLGVIITMMATPTARERIEFSAAGGHITLSRSPLLGGTAAELVYVSDVVGVRWEATTQHSRRFPDYVTDRITFQLRGGGTVQSYGSFENGSAEAARDISARLGVTLECRESERNEPEHVIDC